MKKSNIIHIYGNHSYMCNYDKSELIRIFKEKYEAESVEYFSLDNIQNFGEIYGKLSSSGGLFFERRMFVFSWGRNKKLTKKQEEKSEKDGMILDFSKYLDKILPHFSDSDFLLFYNISPQETTLLTWLKKYATERKHDIDWNVKNWFKFAKISENNLTKILQIYKNGEEKKDKNIPMDPLLSNRIVNSIQNIAILEQENIEITQEILQNFCHPDEWEKMFDFVDAILTRNISKALKISEWFCENTEIIDIFLAGFIGAMRKNLYILYLRDRWYSAEKIAKIFPEIHSFQLQKAYKSTLSHKELGKFFQKITNITIAYRTGKMMKKNILWQFFEIDTALFALKK